MRYMLILFCFLLITGNAYAQDLLTEEPKGFYSDRERGWYWYEVYPEEIDETKEEESQEQESAPSDSQNYTYDELWTMDPDDFKDYFINVTKSAVQFPDQENTERYLKAQDVARRKSVAFAAAVGFFGQQNPQFSNQDVYPITAPGQKALTDGRFKEIDQLIIGVKDDYALIVFIQPGCDYCKAQSSILDYFIRKYNWPVREVDIEENPNMAAQFGITITPSMIVVNKHSEDYLYVSAGVVSMTELKQRIYRSIRYMNGEISPEQWALYDFEKDTGSDPLKFVDPTKRFKKQDTY